MWEESHKVISKAMDDLLSSLPYSREKQQVFRKSNFKSDLILCEEGIDFHNHKVFVRIYRAMHQLYQYTITKENGKKIKVTGTNFKSFKEAVDKLYQQI